MDKQIDGQTDYWTNKLTDGRIRVQTDTLNIYKDRQMDSRTRVQRISGQEQTNGRTDIHAGGPIDRQTDDGQTNRHTDEWTDRRADRRMDIQTNGQTDRRTEQWTDRRMDIQKNT